MADLLGIKPKSMEWLNDLKITIYRVIHFGEGYPHHKFTQFHRGHKIFKAEDVNYDEIEKRLELIGLWYQNNVIDGEVTYEYHPSAEVYNNKARTMVRSTMAVWVLNKLAVHLGNSELKKLGEETLKF